MLDVFLVYRFSSLSLGEIFCDEYFFNAIFLYNNN